MQSKRTSELVEVFYWNCAVSEHRHKTQAVAQACIKKTSTPKEARRKWTKSMMADLLDAVLKGDSWKYAGSQFGVSGGRATHVGYRAISMMSHPSRMTEPYPTHNNHSLADIRQHAAFWMRQTAKLRAE